MDELIRCTLTKQYKTPLDPNIHPCNADMVRLCDHMMDMDAKKRATIKDVIRNPVIIIEYYHSYFQFDV